MHHDHPSTPPPWPYWPPTQHSNGHTFELAALLGRVEAESRRHTEILLGVNDRLIDLPDRLAARLGPIAATQHAYPSSSAPAIPATSAAAPPAQQTASAPPATPTPPPASPPASPPAPSLLQTIGTTRDLVMAVAAIVALGATLTGKITWAQLMEWLLKWQGLK